MKRRYSWKVERLRRNLDSRAFLVGALRRRKAARAIVEEGSMDAVRLLAESLAESEHADVRKIAREALDALEDWRRISAACEIWAETRHPELTALLMKNEWVASMPPEVKVLTALKLGRLDEVTGGDERFVEPLLAACRDPDPLIAERARQVLPRLEEEEAREGLCRLLIEREDPLALEVALEADYYPQEDQQRALFFFLTEQWARYEGLDFDQRLLRMAYAVAGESVRRRVREKLRAAGRTDFLSVIAGQNYQARATEMAQSELDLLMQTLIANQEWPELWDLLFEVSFSRSVSIVEALAGAGWEPKDGQEQALLASLVSFAQGEERLPTSDDEVRGLFPPALLEAQARVGGRINDVAFSPLRPVIAIGTGERKVAVWNYQRAEREQLLAVADHSVGSVTFTGNGTLVWGERTNRTDVPCLIYHWRENGADRVPGVLGQHVGSVTALAPVGDDRVLSTGRDRRITLWDVSNEQAVASSREYRWPRAMQVSPNGQQAVLLYEGLSLIALPNLNVLMGGGGESVGRCAAFLPPGYGREIVWEGPKPSPLKQTLLVGRYNGDVALHYPHYYSPWHRGWIRYEREPFTRHIGRVEGVSVLESRAIAITAGSEGIVRFIDLEDRSTIGEVEVPLGMVTSLHVSPDETFMVVGNSEAQLSFWDIRGLDVLDLLLNPFGRAPTTALTTLGVLKEDRSLPPRAHRTLAFAERVLRHRIRFDIELGAAPTIMAGEFDIEIE